MTEKWEAKLFVITEAKDLAKLTYEELIGIFLTHESMITKQKGTKKKKNLPLVSTSEENISDLTEQMALMLQKSKKILQEVQES